MSNPSRAASKLRKLGKKIEVNANKNTIKLASVIQQTIILATPVDTGRARANWQATVGVPFKRVLDEVDETGSKTISENDSNISKRKFKENIYISNNLAYIKRLNDGYSAQAPKAFVEQAIKTAKTAVKDMRLLTK
jgi:hypothetical protein